MRFVGVAASLVGMIVVVLLAVVATRSPRKRRQTDEGTVTYDVIARKAHIEGNYSTAETFVRGECEEATFCDNIHDNFYEPEEP